MKPSRIFHVVIVLLFLIMLGAPHPTLANEGFQPVSPEELKMMGDPHAPGAPAIILFRQVDRDDNGRTSHQYNYFRIKILTEEGRKYGDVEIPFFKENGNIVNIRARTIRQDGSIVNFDGKVYEKPIVKAKGLKYMAKTFTLPEVQVGNIIEYFYTNDLSEQYIYDSHWILSDDLFTKNAKFSLKPFHNPDSNISVRWSWQGLPPGTEQPKQGPDGIVRLESSNIPAFQTEDFMPPENELKSRVDFLYSDDLPDSNQEKFWKQVGKKRNDKLESFIGKRKAMEQAVSQIVSAGDSPEAKLQKIYARVQQIRNTSFEVEKSEQEQKRDKEKEIPNVEELWKRGYGNGSQLTWLFLALARAAGFEAYGVWASDRSTYFFSPVLMNSNKLNTNVVLVKVNGKDMYFDPGTAFTPYGFLPWAETGVTGLRMDKDGGSWVTTTLPSSTDSQIERSADLRLSDTGDLEGKLTVTYTGLEALSRRIEERNEDDTNKKKFLEDQVKEYVPAAVEVELTNKPEWKSSAPSLVAEFQIKIPGWVSAAGRRAILPVGFFSATEKHLFDHANRVHPVYFEFPFKKVDDVKIELPLGWQVGSVPKPLTEDGHVILYSMKAEDGKTKVHVTRSLDVQFLQLEQKYYMALRNFFQAVRSGDDTQIVLQPGGTAASN